MEPKCINEKAEGLKARVASVLNDVFSSWVQIALIQLFKEDLLSRHEVEYICRETT
jgi:hypothetical protein